MAAVISGLAEQTTTLLTLGGIGAVCAIVVMFLFIIR